MNIAVYARVSRSDETQDPRNQLEPLRNFAKAHDGQILKEYVDRASGSKSDREQFLNMLKDADQKKFDLLLIWSLDRLSREGIPNTLGYIERLKRNGIAIKSFQEPWLDTRDESIGQLLIAIFSWVAKQERLRIVERVNAGLVRAKKQGKILGRPPGRKDSTKRSVSGYHMRYAGKSKEERRLK